MDLSRRVLIVGAWVVSYAGRTRTKVSRFGTEQAARSFYKHLLESPAPPAEQRIFEEVSLTWIKILPEQWIALHGETIFVIQRGCTGRREARVYRLWKDAKLVRESSCMRDAQRFAAANV